MKGSMREIHDEQERALALAVQVAELLDEMDSVTAGAVVVTPGRIICPGVEIRRTSSGFTARTA